MSLWPPRSTLDGTGVDGSAEWGEQSGRAEGQGEKCLHEYMHACMHPRMRVRTLHPCPCPSVACSGAPARRPRLPRRSRACGQPKQHPGRVLAHGTGHGRNKG